MVRRSYFIDSTVNFRLANISLLRTSSLLRTKVSPAEEELVLPLLRTLAITDTERRPEGVRYNESYCSGIKIYPF